MHHLAIMFVATAAATSRMFVRAYTLTPLQYLNRHHRSSSYHNYYRQLSSQTGSTVTVEKAQETRNGIVVMGSASPGSDYEDYYKTLDDTSSEIDEDDVIEDVVISSSLSDSDENVQSDSETTIKKPEIDAQTLREKLIDELKSYRMDQSKPLGKPAYTIFTNASVDGICASLPMNEDELLDIKGIGPKKLELYGDDILDIVKRHVLGGEGGLTPSEAAAAVAAVKPPIPKPPVITIESLTSEQRQAADIALLAPSNNNNDNEEDENYSQPSNVFISGAAGTGKSHVSKFIIQTLKERQLKKCAPTAPTGVAAINVGGSTLHSFFGIGLGIGSMSSLLRKVRKNKEAVKRIDETDVLLIDEVSMLSSDLLETLDGVAREVRKGGKLINVPFGGMQIICVGDFFQLPPIVKQQGGGGGWEGDDRDAIRPFCFDSPVWADLGLTENTFELTNVQRQESGSKFEQFLNMVRVGSVSPDIIRDFNNKCLVSEEHPLPQDGIVPTRLYTHNRDVDAENESRLAELNEELVTCKAMDEWREMMPTGTLASVKKSMKVSIAAEMPDDVNLKVGAQVMLTRNKDLDRGVSGLVNGSRGVVEKFIDDLPVVRFDNGRVEKITRVETMRYNPDGGPGCLIRKQIPLKLGWAITVHKSQGSTLTRAILDISSAFEPGQAYVSLSRVKSIEGLWLERPVRMNNIMVSKRVFDYYQYT